VKAVVSDSFSTAILLVIFFRFVRLAHYPALLAPRVLRLGIQHDAAAGLDQCSLRRILLSVRRLHGSRFLHQTVVGLLDSAIAASQISRLFASDFGPLRSTRRGGLCRPHSDLGTRLSLTKVAIEIVIDYEQLRGTQNETVIKELYIAGDNILEIFQFLSPYVMRSHGDSENGLN